MARELVNPPELHPAPGFSHVATVPGCLIEIECTAVTSSGAA